MRIEPAQRIVGGLTPPPDKSISHRAALIGAICEGKTRVRNYLRADDTASTLAAVRSLGAQVEDAGATAGAVDLVVQGAGLRGAQSDKAIDVGNAGTLLRLLPGWLAGQGKGRWTLDGDESIRRRPVDRVAEPLLRMGARVECRDGRLPPLVVEGAALEGIRYELPVASAQVKSCVLLAGLLAAEETQVVEPLPTRDHTELMLEAAGASLKVERSQAGSTVTVEPAERLALDEVAVPGDFSSASFFIVAASIVPGSELTLESVGINPTRTGLLSVLERMGGNVEARAFRRQGGELVADLAVRPGSLRGTAVEREKVPLLIDELPLVALLGAFAEGETVVSGAEELRHKESDRVATVVDALGNLGAEIEAAPDGFRVSGREGLRGGTIDSFGDHRLAMLGAVAGAASLEGVEVKGFEVASVSYPTFLEDLRSVCKGRNP
jgi:3-phosphoshikimate 1-carboxyvinyltransferase